MYRKLLHSTWFVFLGLIYILNSTDCYSADEYDDEVVQDSANYLRLQNEAEQRSREAVLVDKRNPSFTPFISIGALSNMQQFFHNLRENFRALENLSPEERNALLGKHEQSVETRIFQPPATAAYLHAVRNQKPSQRIRNFVANSEPKHLRGSNYYDPTYLWTGLGRKR